MQLFLTDWGNPHGSRLLGKAQVQEIECLQASFQMTGEGHDFACMGDAGDVVS